MLVFNGWWLCHIRMSSMCSCSLTLIHAFSKKLYSPSRSSNTYIHWGANITWSFSPKYSQKTSNNLPIIARCGVSFVSSKSDLCSADVIAILYIICYDEPCYNSTRLYSHYNVILYDMILIALWLNFRFIMLIHILEVDLLSFLWNLVSWECHKMLLKKINIGLGKGLMLLGNLNQRWMSSVTGENRTDFEHIIDTSYLTSRGQKVTWNKKRLCH